MEHFFSSRQPYENPSEPSPANLISLLDHKKKFRLAYEKKKIDQYTTRIPNRK